MRIVDNFLPHEEYQLIHDSICYCDSFPWYFSPGVSEALDGNVKRVFSRNLNIEEKKINFDASNTQ